MQVIQTICHSKTDWAHWVNPGDPVWYCMSDFSEKEIAKSAGLSFHGRKNESGKWVGRMVYWTNDIDKAAMLADYAVGECRAVLEARRRELTASIAMSKKATSDLILPCPEGLDYLPFQKVGIEYMLNKPDDIKGTLLTDEPGLGKTIQIIGLYNADESIKTMLVICPAKLKFNWKREFNKWKTRDVKVAIADTTVCPTPEHGYNIVITNYDSLPKLNRELSKFNWDVVAVDEAHNYRNSGTLRFKAFRGDEEKCWNPINGKRYVLATGTPVVNRPKELWNLLCLADPQKWNSKTHFLYKKKYCGAKTTSYGFDDKGAGDDASLRELHNLLRSRCMIRRRKVDVLPELPRKIRQVIELEWDSNDENVIKALEFEKTYRQMHDDDMMLAAIEIEMAKASEDVDLYKAAIKKITEINKVAFTECAKVRRQTAVAKIPYAIDYVEGLLESQDKIVIFAHHQDVLHAFAKKWPLESMTIDGSISSHQTQKNVDRFQTDPNCRIALISILAGGVGLTLTAASWAVFIEDDWVPGNNTQAEDRMHRIGQLKTVYAMHLVLMGSIDVHIAKTVIEKQEIIDKILDDDGAPIIVTKDQAATKKTTRQQIEKDAVNVTQLQTDMVQHLLRYLATCDEDRALSANAIGYNKIDSAIGHRLADCTTLTKKQTVLGMSLLKKYRRQLPVAMYNNLYNIQDEGW